MEQERIDLKTQLMQRRAVEFEVRFTNGKVRSGGIVRAAQADVLRHEAVIPAQAHASELEGHAPRPQSGHEPCLEKFRQADAVQVSESAQQKENEKKKTDPAPADAASKSLPETGLGGWRHIRESRPPRQSNCAPLHCKRRRF